MGRLAAFFGNILNCPKCSGRAKTCPPLFMDSDSAHCYSVADRGTTMHTRILVSLGFLLLTGWQPCVAMAGQMHPASQTNQASQDGQRGQPPVVHYGDVIIDNRSSVIPGFAGTWTDPESGDIVTSVIAPRQAAQPQGPVNVYVAPGFSDGGSSGGSSGDSSGNRPHEGGDRPHRPHGSQHGQHAGGHWRPQAPPMPEQPGFAPGQGRPPFPQPGQQTLPAAPGGHRPPTMPSLPPANPGMRGR